MNKIKFDGIYCGLIKKYSDTDTTNTGKKYDTGKLRYDLVKPEMLEAIAEVMTYGANKYGDNNWQGVETDRYYAALMRHLQAWRKGELVDEESGLHHLKHALCNIAFILSKELER